MSREKKINRELLVATVKRICLEIYKEVTVSDLIHKGGQRRRIEIEADGVAFYMDFHFKENGSTSIDVSSGQHIEDKKQIMLAILSDVTCLLTADEQ